MKMKQDQLTIKQILELRNTKITDITVGELPWGVVIR